MMQCSQQCRMFDKVQATCEKPAGHDGRHRGISIDPRLDLEWDRYESDTCAAPQELDPWGDEDIEGTAVLDSVEPKEQG